MPELHLPWLELSILTPLVGAFFLWRWSNQEVVWKHALIITAITLLLTTGAWQDFSELKTFEAHDHWSVIPQILGDDVVVIDELSAPLLPLSALLYFSIVLATARTKVQRFPFALTSLSLALLLAMLSCRQPWVVIALMAAQTFLPMREIRARGHSTRVFSIHMGLFIGLLIVGWLMLDVDNPQSVQSTLAICLLVAGVLIRSGVVPLHCWMTDLFEKAAFGTSLLFVTPMVGAYAMIRLVLPVASDWALHTVVVFSLVTAIYAAAMALVQWEARRFFCYLFLSNSSLVLVGLGVATPISMTGALCVWLSVGISLVGLGLTMRAVEARTGQVSLVKYQGLYEHMPYLAVFFLITGLASIGFPGTVGFIGAELLVEGAISIHPLVAVIVVATAALNGIAVLHAYFHIFTGTEHTSLISLKARWPEKIAVLVLTALILGGGLMPQPGVSSRYHAAAEILIRRTENLSTPQDD